MSQLNTLIWLKWKLFRNSLRSSKAVANQVALVLGMLVALALSLIVALGLGFAAYMLTGHLSDSFRETALREFPTANSSELIFFSILAFTYLMWATVPLSIGSAKQFDVSKMLMYPISLRKLFVFDFISEVTTLQSVFAIPAVVALGVGAGLGSGRMVLSLLATIPMVVFGVALSKWLSTIMGALVRRKRSRGETLVALIGAVAGLGGALAGQVAPVIFRHAEAVRSLRWTPPGAAAALLVGKDLSSYVLAFIILSFYALALITFTYWIARRAVLGLGGKRKRSAGVVTTDEEALRGWSLPLLSPQLSAMIEKEFRYASRNAQLRTLALMPLVLIIIRFFNTRRSGNAFGEAPGVGESFLSYGSGLMTTGGVLYVFLILGGLSCNLFAFEEGGMRTLILAPIDRKKILIGKNITIVAVAFIFSVLLVTINAVVFRDVTAGDLLFTALNFVIFATIMSVAGNWFSITFPKHMKFGKRMNVSGVPGLLLIPLMLVLGIPPLLAVTVGYMTSNWLIEYGTLAAFAALSVVLYCLVVGLQGQALANREIAILEAVKEPADE